MLLYFLVFVLSLIFVLYFSPSHFRIVKNSPVHILNFKCVNTKFDDFCLFFRISVWRRAEDHEITEWWVRRRERVDEEEERSWWEEVWHHSMCHHGVRHTLHSHNVLLPLSTHHTTPVARVVCHVNSYCDVNTQELHTKQCVTSFVYTKQPTTHEM